MVFSDMELLSSECQVSCMLDTEKWKIAKLNLSCTRDHIPVWEWFMRVFLLFYLNVDVLFPLMEQTLWFYPEQWRVTASFAAQKFHHSLCPLCPWGVSCLCQHLHIAQESMVIFSLEQTGDTCT